MEITRVPEIGSLKDLIDEIYKVFEEDQVDVDYMMQLMKNYKSNPEDWRKYAKFDRYKYTRNLVDAGNGKFDLMLLCWGPSLASTIHDHADAHCFMKVLDGDLQEVRFHWPEGEDQPMREASRGCMGLDEVCYINDSLGLHRVENPSNTMGAVSLHLYCPPYQQCKAFDERTGNIMKCQITFYSKFGEKVKHGGEKNPNKCTNYVK